jgi:hypothetical protein
MKKMHSLVLIIHNGTIAFLKQRAESEGIMGMSYLNIDMLDTLQLGLTGENFDFRSGSPRFESWKGHGLTDISAAFLSSSRQTQ